MTRKPIRETLTKDRKTPGMVFSMMFVRIVRITALPVQILKISLYFRVFLTYREISMEPVTPQTNIPIPNRLICI